METKTTPAFYRVFSAIGLVGSATLAFVALLEALAYCGYRLRWISDQGDTRHRLPGYQEYGWAKDFWEEERRRFRTWHVPYEPFRIWGLPEWHGKFMNVENRGWGNFRRTEPSASCSEPVVIAMFGGSTLYGEYVPDAYTIPSLLSRYLNESALCVQVDNFGVHAYNTNQELLLLFELVKKGYRPDLAIFYDGTNDSLVGGLFRNTFGHYDEGEIRRLLEKRNIERDLLKRFYLPRFLAGLQRRLESRAISPVAATGGQAEAPPSRSVPLPTWDEEGRRVLDNYEKNLSLVSDLARSYGFLARFFWQPNLFYGSKRLEPIEIEQKKRAAPGEDAVTEAIYREAKRRAEKKGTFAFWGDLFNGVDKPLFVVDWLHVNPRGNERVARQLADSLRSEVMRLRQSVKKRKAGEARGISSTERESER